MRKRVTRHKARDKVLFSNGHFLGHKTHIPAKGQARYYRSREEGYRKRLESLAREIGTKPEEKGDSVKERSKRDLP